MCAKFSFADLILSRVKQQFGVDTAKSMSLNNTIASSFSIPMIQQSNHSQSLTMLDLGVTLHWCKDVPPCIRPRLGNDKKERFHD